MRTECVARVESPDGCEWWTDRKSLVCPASVSDTRRTGKSSDCLK
jgi:hypothetical protein